MPEIALPTSDFARVTVELDQGYQVNRSVWTGRRRASQLPGAEKWSATLETLPINTELDERPWRAFMVMAALPVNVFRVPVACQQTTSGNPSVASTATGTNTLNLSGLSPLQEILTAGQYMTVQLSNGHRRLVMLVQSLVSDAAGQGIATFLPGLAGTALAGAAVEIQNPFLYAAMTSSRQGWTTENGLTSFTINAEEAL